MLGLGDRDIGVGAAVDVIERTVFEEAHAHGTRNIEYRAGSRGQVHYGAAAAAGGLTEKRYLSTVLERTRNKVSAGEAYA